MDNTCVMEQLNLEVTSKHMEDKKVIRNSQHEYTKGKSCLRWWDNG